MPDKVFEDYRWQISFQNRFKPEMYEFPTESVPYIEMFIGLFHQILFGLG